MGTLVEGASVSSEGGRGRQCRDPPSVTKLKTVVPDTRSENPKYLYLGVSWVEMCRPKTTTSRADDP